MRPFHKILLALTIAGLIGGVVLIMGSISRKAVAEPIPYANLTNVVQELMSIGEFYRSPEPNPAGTELVFMRTGETKRRLYKADLKTGAVQMLPHKPDLRRIFGWSPDGRYLLFMDENVGEWLRLYDTKDGSFKRATKEPNRSVAQAVWLDANRFVYISKLDDKAELRLVTVGQEHKVLRVFATPGTMDWMAVMSEQQVAYLENREIWSFNIESQRATQMTTNVADQFLWLTFSRENQEFLFCSDDASDWRHLFRLSVSPEKGTKMTQLTFGPEHTYNGQWVQGGFAYVANITNHFYLAVRTADPARSTNLFSGGHVLAYRVSADQRRIYAAAAVGAEPPGIWEYDIAAKVLRAVVPGTDQPLQHSQSVAATEHRVTSFDSLPIPYYLLEPRGIQKDRKYPVIIAIPPEDGQFVQAWDKYSQLFANIGAFFVAANPRGADGYGRAYMKKDSEEAYKDILAVREAVLANQNADGKRVFLFTYSNGSATANHLVSYRPDLWDGVALVSGTPPPAKSYTEKRPRFFLFVGDKDAAGVLKRVDEFKKMGDEKGLPVTVLHDKNTAHHVTDLNVDRKLGLALAEFIYNQQFPTQPAEPH